jgi:hypothetical protein
MMSLPAAAATWIGFVILLGLSAVIIVLSAGFNRNIGRGTMTGQKPSKPEVGMIMRVVYAITQLIWRLVSSKTRVPLATDDRIRLFSEAHANMEEREYWRKNFEAAYELLGILNEKAEALMVYSGVTLAVVSVANIHPAAEHATMVGGWISERLYSAVIAIVIFASIFCSLVVVGIFWPFLHYAIAEPGRSDFDLEWRHLLKVLVVRQNCYQISWLLAVFALLLLVPFVFAFGL